ncbi:glycosyltransferase family 21 protein [Cyathus striatus]|nr:glycosyltransferase family 21 protein [Cyathus striatus]
MNSESLKLAFSVFGIGWYSVICSLSLLGCVSARRRYRLRPKSPYADAPPSSVPGVSILRPLKGLDTNLYENLESTFNQEYANYEILFSVADEDDQALPIVRELITKYPNVNARIIIGEEIVGVNPKVNNLIRSYRAASNDILWVLDSNIVVDQGTLARSVALLEGPSPSAVSRPRKRVALVHHVPFAFINESQLGSRIEEAFLNTTHAKMYIGINTVAIDSCVVGKSNLYRRSDVERVNGSLKPRRDDLNGSEPLHDTGLHAFGRFLAEDNMIAGALWHELDLRHDLSCDVAKNVVGNMTLSDYISRRIRWIRVRKHMVLVPTLIEPFTESILLSMILATSLQYLITAPILIVSVVHFGLWLFIDLDVYASLAGHPLPKSVAPQFLGAWLARELLAFPIWLVAIVGDEVTWRGQSYKVLRNGEVEKVARGNSYSYNWMKWFRINQNQDFYQRVGEPLEI